MSELNPLQTALGEAKRRISFPPSEPPRHGWLWAVLAVASAAASGYGLWWAFQHEKAWTSGKMAWVCAGFCALSVAGMVSASAVFQRGSTLQRLVSGSSVFVLFPVSFLSGFKALICVANILMKGHGVSPFM